MKAIDPASLSKKENYAFLTQTIVPRPIAFVTTLSKDGVLNAAPFSYFNVVSADPPLLMISIGKRGGDKKDTSRNIVETGSFVVHVTDEANVEEMNATAANLPPDESEVERVGLTPVESTVIDVPGLKEARVRFECKLEKHMTFTGNEGETDVIFGRILHYHVADEVMGESGKVEADKLKPVARLGGKEYAPLGEIFTIDRPK
ncbi:flavin reductase family protein [Alteribacter keqinensis]|uniref:Flavin reductase family protein n=1 Tax=Alteribacter keqinensis TaxID=2483800 RepID=A0A3M7TR23_9BACI|nr:flavin reductase family protein [Alteribacter keqinensis]RNA66800.1 flavin reductase family protein [Alteribacter keqinensis]